MQFTVEACWTICKSQSERSSTKEELKMVDLSKTRLMRRNAKSLLLQAQCRVKSLQLLLLFQVLLL